MVIESGRKMPMCAQFEINVNKLKQLELPTDKSMSQFYCWIQKQIGIQIVHMYSSFVNNEKTNRVHKTIYFQ
jgi:hypothetical protein